MTAGVLSRQPVDAGGIALDTVVLGDGPVTAVFVNGLGAPLEEWALVAPVIAERCRVVCYDRRTAPPNGRLPTHDAAQVAADLDRLLDALGVTGPLILVGHSWGGPLIRRYASAHPNSVAGMVFIDASHENIKGIKPTWFTRALYTTSTMALRVGPIRRRLLRMLGFDRLPPETLAFLGTLPWLAEGRTALAEYGGIGASLRELELIAPDLPPVPIRVLLAAGRPGLITKLGARQIAAIRAVWEKAVAGRDEFSLQIVPDSGHYVSLDQPQVVIDAIDDVARRVSTSHVS